MKKVAVLTLLLVSVFAGAGAVLADIDSPDSLGPIIQTEEVKLTPDGGGGRFGQSISISGDTAVVGAPNCQLTCHGTVYIYVLTDGVWVKETQLWGEANSGNNAFGWSVSISGDTVVVGDMYLKDNGKWSGGAYVFVRNGGVWTFEDKLLASDGWASDLFGQSVSIDGDNVVVGAWRSDGQTDRAGKAYVFERDQGVWTEQAILLGANEGDLFGWSVSINGHMILIGAPGSGVNGFESGAAYFVTFDGTAWSLPRLLEASDGQEKDHFGQSVFLTEHSALVGAPGDDDNGSGSGSSYVFTRDTGWLIDEKKIMPSDGGNLDHFGESVSVNGDTLLVGAYTDGDNGTRSGSAYVFTNNGGVWSEQSKLLASDGEEEDRFGTAVSVIENTAIVGAAEDGIGSAYVYLVPIVFRDGFESGDTSAWSSTVQ